MEEAQHLEIKMGPFDDNKGFRVEIKSEAPMLMEHVACVLYELFLKHCEQIELDPKEVTELQNEIRNAVKIQPEQLN